MKVENPTEKTYIRFCLPLPSLGPLAPLSAVVFAECQTDQPHGCGTPVLGRAHQVGCVDLEFAEQRALQI